MPDLGLLTLAFSLGAAAFINPCSFALLPAYLSYLLGKKDKMESGEEFKGINGIIQGSKNGLLASLGFFAVFGSIGAFVSLTSAEIKPFLPIVLLIVGPSLIILGLLWVYEKNLYMTNLFSKVELSKSSTFLFGTAYALGSLSCVFPIFLGIVLMAIGTGGFVSGFLIFLSYVIGMSIVMMIASIAIALSKEFLIKSFKKTEKYIKKISGTALVLAGLYLIYYWYTTYGLESIL